MYSSHHHVNIMLLLGVKSSEVKIFCEKRVVCTLYKNESLLNIILCNDQHD